MSAADELRAAATRLEDLAAETTPGPWTAENGEDSWSLHSGPKQILKAPKHGTPYAEYWPDEADAAWIVGVGPQVAAPLAAWLRAEAEVAESVDTLQRTVPKIAEAVEEMVTGQVSPGFRLRLTASSLDEALAFARAINGGAPDA